MRPDFANHWNRFFFAEVDARVYAAIRIAVGGVLMIHLAILGPNWITWFGETGVLDSASARANVDADAWSLLFWFENTPTALWFCYVVIVVQITALTLGFATRFNSICVFIWLVSLQHRNNLIWEGEDVLLRIICFLMIFMPAARRWSIDALWRRRQTKDPAAPAAPVVLPARVTAWPVRLLQLQLSLIYLSTVVSKMGGATWRDGTALHYVFRLDEFSGHRLPVPDAIADTLPLLRLLAWLTLAIELLLVFGVWVPSMRKPTVFVGLAFHLALELTMNLFLFQWLMMLILSTHLVTPLPGRNTSKAPKNPQLE